MVYYPESVLERVMKVQEVILKAMSREILWVDAADILGISPRSMRRWRERYEEYGYDGLYDRRKGMPSPKRVPMDEVKKVKKEYPQLRICLLLDSLYARRPVFKLCERFGWKYIIVFKEGSNPELYNWYELIRDKFHQKDYKEWILKDIVQKYCWVSPLEHYTDEKFHIFECTEKDARKPTTKRWVWITNIEITEKNVVKLANHGGRLRWKIENEGFNSQKNGGYELEHAYKSCLFISSAE